MTSGNCDDSSHSFTFTTLVQVIWSYHGHIFSISPLTHLSILFGDRPNQVFHGIMYPFAALQVPLLSPVFNIVLLIHPVSSSKGCRSYFWSSLISVIISMLCAIPCQRLVSRPRDKTAHGLKAGNNNHT